MQDRDVDKARPGFLLNSWWLPSGSLSRYYSGQLSNFVTRFQNMKSDTELTAMDAPDTKTLANSTSPQPESNGRHPGPGFGKLSIKQKFFIRSCLSEKSWAIRSHLNSKAIQLVRYAAPCRDLQTEKKLWRIYQANASIPSFRATSYFRDY